MRRPREALFPSFFMGGFECSTHVDRSHRRQDYVQLMQHDRCVREDYERALTVGLRAVREGPRWYLCERSWSTTRGGTYDFSSFAPMLEAAQQLGLMQLTCLLHYGLPDGVDPLNPDFAPRFTEFCQAFAAWRSRQVDGPRWYAVVNELSLFAWAMGEAAWFAPFYKDKGEEIKEALVAASLRATDAVRAVDSEARFLSVDPAIHLVTPHGRDDLAKEVERQNRAQYQAWDMAMGRVKPELGGTERYVDVIGINCYQDSQKEIETDEQLAIDDPRRRPFREVLCEIWERYQRPIILAETSARGEERPVWLRYVVDECLAALERGVDLQGICLYPVIDMREWVGGNVGPWGHLGLWELEERGERLERVACQPYLAALAEAQAKMEASGLLPRYRAAARTRNDAVSLRA
jgi:beta-glucosidase/6-phospho-beta-glucosidase/beta-galactosidase